VRTLSEEVRVFVEKRLKEIVEHTAAAYGAKASLTYRRNYPVLVNHERETEIAAAIAGGVVGENNVDTNLPAMMGAEDFSFMLNARPGAFIWVGNGDSAGLHNPRYNFNDEVIPFGTSYWVKLAETRLA
jgi:hippurate hydrolase